MSRKGKNVTGFLGIALLVFIVLTGCTQLGIKNEEVGFTAQANLIRTIKFFDVSEYELSVSLKGSISKLTVTSSEGIIATVEPGNSKTVKISGLYTDLNEAKLTVVAYDKEGNAKKTSDIHLPVVSDSSASPLKASSRGVTDGFYYYDTAGGANVWRFYSMGYLATMSSAQRAALDTASTGMTRYISLNGKYCTLANYTNIGSPNLPITDGTFPTMVLDMQLGVYLNTQTGEYALSLLSAEPIGKMTVVLEFTKAVTAGTGLTFTVNGAVPTGIAYSGTTVTLTVAQMVYGTVYTVIVTYPTIPTSWTETFTYDLLDPATLTATQESFYQTVGQNITIEYTLRDTFGTVLPGRDVFIRLNRYLTTLGTWIEATEHTVTTDSNGKASLTFTRNEATPPAGPQNVKAYPVEDPTIVNEAIWVHWTIAQTGLVTTSDTANKTLGYYSDVLNRQGGTIRDFSVTFLNSDGTPKLTGNVFIEMNEAIINLTNPLLRNYALYVRDLSVADPNAINAWYLAADNAFFPNAGILPGNFEADTSGVAGNNHYQLALKPETELGIHLNVTSQGAVLFRLVGLYAGQYIPTFYYNSMDAYAPLEPADPMARAGSTTFVLQAPVFTITAVHPEREEVATTPAPLGTLAQQEEYQYKRYELEIVDQFGDPFRGVVTFGDYLYVDNSGATNPFAMNALMDWDTSKNGVYDDPGKGLGTTLWHWEMMYNPADRWETQNDGKRNLRVYNNLAQNNLRLTVWLDKNNNGQINAGEPKAVAPKVDFVNRALSQINVQNKGTTKTSSNGVLRFVAKVFDQFGDGMLPSTLALDAVVRRVITPGVAPVYEYDDGSDTNPADTYFTIEADNRQAGDLPWLPANLIPIAQGTGGVPLGNLDYTNEIEFRVTEQNKISLFGGGGTPPFANALPEVEHLIIFQSDGNRFVHDNGANVQNPWGKADFEIVAPDYYTTELFATDIGGANTVERADWPQVDWAAGPALETVPYWVSDMAAPAADRTVRFTYRKIDAAGFPFGNGTEAVNFTIKNTGSHPVKVSVAGGGQSTLTAGNTQTFYGNFFAGAINIDVEADNVNAKTKIEITARCPALLNSTKSTVLYFYSLPASDTAGETFIGNLVGMDQTAAAEFVVLDTTPGYAKIDYTVLTAVTYSVDGTVATQQQFQDELEYGRKVTSTTTAGPVTTINVDTN